MKRWRAAVIALGGILAALPLAAQPGASPNMAANMQAISQALGVTCNYCHTAAPGSGQAEPKKDIARAMMAMTRDINSKIAAAVGKPAAEVLCVTCHRGVADPRPLPDILSETLRENGVAAAVTQYRQLHERYYGRDTYDFGEETLIGLAQRIANGRADDAIALLQLNLEFYPKSARTYIALAYAYTRKVDDASAMAALEKALAIEPDNGVARGQLEQLRSYHRKR
jgi:tetratricopeptide (TPR) repeat protein